MLRRRIGRHPRVRAERRSRFGAFDATPYGTKGRDAAAGRDDLYGTVWQQALLADDFENATRHHPASEATVVRFLYDDKNLYVAWTCDQPGAPLTATQSVDDVGYGLDDEVTLAVDTSGNGSRVYTFTATPRGVKYESSTESARYQPPWTALAHATAHGYNVLMIVPLSDMRPGSGAVQSWKINFSRWIAARGDLLSWAYDPNSVAYCLNAGAPATEYCDPTRWPTLAVRFARAAKVPPPYADLFGLESSGSDAHVFPTPAQGSSVQPIRHAGLDLTYPFTQTLAFVGTLGPDYSNVETDQVSIAPQQFTRQYAEYRPFFAEVANYIASLPNFSIIGPASQMFYSPALAILDSGYKVEGTIGKSNLGMLGANGEGFDDQAFGYSYSQPDGSLALSLQGVAAHHPGLVDTTLGAGLSSQNPHSGVSEFANVQQESGTLVGDSSLARSAVVSFALFSGPWKTGAAYSTVGPEFGPVDGYTPSDDIAGPGIFAFYNGVGKAGSRIKSYTLGSAAQRYVDRSGAARNVAVFYQAELTFSNLLSLNLNTLTSELRSYGIGYPTYAQGFDASYNQNSISLDYGDGTPSPTDLSYTFGPFAVQCGFAPTEPLPCADATDGVAPAQTQAVSLATTRSLRGGLSATVTYAGTLERPFTGIADSQWLRSLTLTKALGKNGLLALDLRETSGTGGFALPGENLAVSFHQRFANQSQLYLGFGSPATFTTLNRLIVKYVYHLGAGAAGT